MTIRTISVFVVVGVMLSVSVTPVPQETGLIFEPPLLEVVRDSSGYVQQMISVRSVTGDTVRMTSISGSCKCANGSVQRPLAHDTVPGKFYVAINAKHFEDSVNYVDYTIGHTGQASPSVFRVVVRINTEEQP